MNFSYKNYLLLSLLFSSSLVVTQQPLNFEIVPFDYCDPEMKERLCTIVRDDQEIQKMTQESEESMRQFLSSFDEKHKSRCFICRSTDGLNIVYGYMMYCMSLSAYLVSDHVNTKPLNLLFNATYADEYAVAEPIAGFIKFGFLDNFAVHKDYRGQGIAQAMLDYFEQDCRAQGMQQIVLGVEPDNDKARRAYRKFGFCDHSVYSIVMTKKLN